MDMGNLVLDLVYGLVREMNYNLIYFND